MATVSIRRAWAHAPTALLAIRRAVATSTSGGSSSGSVHRTSTAPGSPWSQHSAASPSAQRQQQKELEEDKLLEEEEFAALHQMLGTEEEEGGEDEAALGRGGGWVADYVTALPRRRRQRARALEMERGRLRWALFERRQLLASLHAASVLMRPPHMAAVLKKIQSSPQQQGEGAPSMSELYARTAASSYLHWKGSSSVLVHWWGRLRGRFEAPPANAGKAGGESPPSALTTLTADLEYLRQHRALHLLSYHRRLNLTPKRNLWHAIFHMCWNVYISVANAVASVFSYPFLPPSASPAPSAPGQSGRTGRVPPPCVALSPLSMGVGLAKGVWVGASFLWYGLVVSPLIHLPAGACNSVLGTYNFLTGKLMFDAISGRWMRCTVLDTHMLRLELQREKRLIRSIGRMEFKRSKMKSEDKWKQRMASLGFSMDNLQEQMMGGGNKKTKAGKVQSKRVFNPYDALNVKRSATQAVIKAQYKKLAMVFHPDVAQGRGGGALTDAERRHAQEKFEEISKAYQILSNAEKRKAYDMGGESGLAMHDSKYGSFLSRTPEEVVQSLFGGEAFRRLLVGELLRSHWALRYEAQVSISLHELEELQSIRVRQMAMELAQMADVHAMGAPSTGPSTAAAHSRSAAASRGGGRGAGGVPSTSKKQQQQQPHQGQPKQQQQQQLVPGSHEDADFSQQFMDRCEAFVQRMSEACFGRELLHEIGLSYVAGAQRFLGLTRFYAPKALVTRKIFTGIDRVYYAFKDAKSPTRDDPHAKQLVARKVMIEYFNMEYDNVVADLHICLRFAVQIVLQDVSVSEAVRRRRCYAVWYIGQKMLEKGLLFGTSRKEEDGEMLAYIQQAATSAATTAKPKPF
eukprot:gene8942-6274_t